jgi:hypothetical protein
MNMIVKFFTERIFIIVFGLAITLVGIISPKYALMHLLTTFQRVKVENTYKKF